MVSWVKWAKALEAWVALEPPLEAVMGGEQVATPMPPTSCPKFANEESPRLTSPYFVKVLARVARPLETFPSKPF